MRRLGSRYRLDEEIGSGGVAVVYAAVDERSGARVALKELLPQFAADRSVRRRFLREAEITRSLDHPSIVKLLDAGEDGPAAYLVLELCDGEDLRRRLDRVGRLPWPEALAVFTSAAGALGHAHRRGVVHRDVKPQNILVGDQGEVKLTDFGSARVQTLAGLTGSSLVWGSPEYMAPEVFARGRVDPRTDLFSMGVVLYEMATGRLPWGRSAPLARLTDGVSSAPPPTGLGPEVDRALASLLAADPTGRPPSAEDAIALVAGGAPATELVTTTRCPACGARRPDDLPRCVACGREELAVRHEAGGGYRVVLKKIGDDATQMARVHELLEGLTGRRDLRLKFLVGDARLYSKREQKEAIKLPAVLFSDLDRQGAGRIDGAFRAAKLETTFTAYGNPPPADGSRPRHVARTAALAGGATLIVFGAMMAGLVGPGFVGLVAAGAAVLGIAAAIEGKRRSRSREYPGLFRLLDRGASVPAADRLLDGAAGAASAVRAPEVRALFADISTELYRLARRAERLAAGALSSAEEGFARRVLAAAPAVVESLRAMAGRLDALDVALERQSEGEAVQALARLQRRLNAAGAEEREALDATRRDLTAALESRHATETERTRLQAGLCRLLSELRDTVRGAAALPTPAEREAEAVERAATELEAYLDGSVGPSPQP